MDYRSDPDARRLYAALTSGIDRLSQLVAESQMPRRCVQEELKRLGVGKNPQGTFLPSPELLSNLGEFMRYSWEVDTELAYKVRQVESVVFRSRAKMPKARRDLDHVAATPATISHRVSHLIANYDLTNTRILFLGDHDITSVGLASVLPNMRAAVVDVDEELLSHLHSTFVSLGAKTSIAYSDLRFPLHDSLQRSYDLVVTDPPYSEPGMRTFLQRSYEALDPLSRMPRVLLAFGFSHLRPDTGWRVQRAILESGFAISSLLPRFNVYEGAEAIGSQAGLYELIPLLGQPQQRLKSTGRLYSHGRLSVESAPPSAIDSNLWREIDALFEDVPSSPLLIQGFTPIGSSVNNKRVVKLETVFSKGANVGLGASCPIIDMREQIADSFLHIAVALRMFAAPSFGILCEGQSEATWRSATDRWSELFGISTTAAGRLESGELLLMRFDVDGSAGIDAFQRRLLERPHGRLANLLREGLIRLFEDKGEMLSKKAATAITREMTECGRVVGPVWSMPEAAWRAILGVKVVKST
jgi:N4-bis(aminopropyl)spermidine synthase